MSKFDDRVLNLIQTVVESEFTAVREELLDDAPTAKAELGPVLEKLDGLEVWCENIKREVKEIQDKISSSEKKEEKRDKKNDPDRREKFKRGTKKLLDIIRKYADRGADYLLPDGAQQLLQPLTDDQFFNEYDDDGISDRVENMIDNLITNLPLMLFWKNQFSTLLHAIAGITGPESPILRQLKNVKDGLDDRLDSVVNDYLDTIKMVQEADHSNILDIVDALDNDIPNAIRNSEDRLADLINSLGDAMSACCQQMQNKIDSVKSAVDGLTSDVGSVLTELSNTHADVLESSGKMDGYAESILQSISDIPTADNAQTLSAISGLNKPRRVPQ